MPQILLIGPHSFVENLTKQQTDKGQTESMTNISNRVKYLQRHLISMLVRWGHPACMTITRTTLDLISIHPSPTSKKSSKEAKSFNADTESSVYV